MQHRCRLIDGEKQFFRRNPEMLALTRFCNRSKSANRSEQTPLPVNQAPLTTNATESVIKAMRESNQAEINTIWYILLKFRCVVVTNRIANVARKNDNNSTVPYQML